LTSVAKIKKTHLSFQRLGSAVNQAIVVTTDAPQTRQQSSPSYIFSFK